MKIVFFEIENEVNLIENGWTEVEGNNINEAVSLMASLDLSVITGDEVKEGFKFVSPTEVHIYSFKKPQQEELPIEFPEETQGESTENHEDYVI